MADQRLLQVENCAAAVSPNMMWITFSRPHKGLANQYPQTLRWQRVSRT